MTAYKIRYQFLGESDHKWRQFQPRDIETLEKAKSFVNTMKKDGINVQIVEVTTKVVYEERGK